MRFGDKLAMAGLEVTKQKVADLRTKIDQDTIRMLKMGYMDIGAGGKDKSRW